MVQATGLEPAQVAPMEPKSIVSANFTMPAYRFDYTSIMIVCQVISYIISDTVIIINPARKQSEYLTKCSQSE